MRAPAATGDAGLMLDDPTPTVFALTLAAGVALTRMGISLNLLVRRNPSRCAACGRMLSRGGCRCLER
jgi:hypothetical protein